MTMASGTPCWTDLSTPDLDKAKAFYGELMGWTFGETKEEFAGYTQAYKDGKAVAALMPMMPDMNLPSWTLYFSADDIDKTVQSINDAGGSVISPPMAVMELGSMAVVADPTGGVFGLWQAGTFGGGELFNEPGSLTWEDLRSSNPGASRNFFTSVFGYRHDDLPMGTDMDYKTFAFADADRPLGGMGDMMGAEGLPSHWVVYLKVEDTPTAEKKVIELGGTVIMPFMATPFGRQAVVSDPFGAAFCIIDSDTAG